MEHCRLTGGDGALGRIKSDADAVPALPLHEQSGGADSSAAAHGDHDPSIIR